MLSGVVMLESVCVLEKKQIFQENTIKSQRQAQYHSAKKGSRK